jgi:putative flippase GtrA
MALVQAAPGSCSPARYGRDVTTLATAAPERVVRATKSLIGSVVATACSEATFVACYGLRVLGTTGSSGVAFVAGAIPNYVLNRRWAWQRRGPVRIWREVVLYVAVSLLSFGASALATGWAGHAARHVTDDHLVKTLLVSGAYLGTFALLFVAKFAAYEFVIFVDPDRSRHHVPTTTLENRQP